MEWRQELWSLEEENNTADTGKEAENRSEKRDLETPIYKQYNKYFLPFLLMPEQIGFYYSHKNNVR